MKKLYRSNNGYILGLCQGIGEYFEIDPNIIRILFIICSPSILLYLIISIFIPKNPLDI